jgi:hypothetical protein
MLNTSEVGTQLPARQRKVIVTSIRSRRTCQPFPHAPTLALAWLISSALWAATEGEFSGTNPRRSARLWRDLSTHRVLFECKNHKNKIARRCPIIDVRRSPRHFLSPDFGPSERNGVFQQPRLFATATQFNTLID